MDPLEQLRARIAGFPGYDGDLERRRSDEFVRSYLGEALADLAVRCAGALSPEAKQRIDALLLRLGFADPKSFAVHHVIAGAHVLVNGGGAVAAEDFAAVEVAERAPRVEPDAVGAYLDDVAATLDRRDTAMRAAAASKA